MFFRQGIQGISDLIAVPGLINVDFADVKTIMANKGSALMGIGMASGENRAAEAAKKAISSPLLETPIDGAQGVLLNITGDSNLSLFEVQEAADIVANASDQDLNMIFGSVINDNLKGEIIVTVIATGFNEEVIQAKTTSPSIGGQQQKTGVEVTKREPKREFIREEVPIRQPRTNKVQQGDDILEIPTFLRNRNNKKRIILVKNLVVMSICRWQSRHYK